MSRCLLGGWTCTLSVEQRVCNELNRREQCGHYADHVPSPLPYQQGALEPDDRRSGLQRPKNLHGDEFETLWRVDSYLQNREAKVSFIILLFVNCNWMRTVSFPSRMSTGKRRKRKRGMSCGGNWPSWKSATDDVNRRPKRTPQEVWPWPNKVRPL